MEKKMKYQFAILGVNVSGRLFQFLRTPFIPKQTMFWETLRISVHITKRYIVLIPIVEELGVPISPRDGWSYIELAQN
jgi:hypothetical protein